METAVSANLILWLAFAIGCIFGGIGQKTHFCTMGAVSDIVNMSDWLSYIVGGATFGVGMVLASGCGSKTLIRIGGGNLKSLVVCVVLGVVAYMTMRGIFGVFRVNVLQKAAIILPGGQDVPALLSAAGFDPGMAFRFSVLAIGGGLTAACLLKRDFRTFDNLLGRERHGDEHVGVIGCESRSA